MQMLEHLLTIVEDFERASGSQINRGKTALVPGKLLSARQELDCKRRWTDLRISYCKRLLGLYVGVHATIDDQHRAPLAKFDEVYADFQGHGSSLSLAVRVVVFTL